MRFFILRPLLLLFLVLIALATMATQAIPAPPRAMMMARPMMAGRPATALNLFRITPHRFLALNRVVIPNRFMMHQPTPFTLRQARRDFLLGSRFANPFSGFSGGPLPMMFPGAGGGGGYGGGYSPGGMAGGNNMPQAAPAYENPDKEETPESTSPNAFDYLGLPSSEGALNWPLGLRILAPTLETTPLRQKLEAELKLVAMQAVAGKFDADLLKQTAQHAQDLRRYLASNEIKLTPHAAREARQFLDTLDASLKARQAHGKEPADARTPQEPTATYPALQK